MNAGGSYTADQRRAIAASIERDTAPPCPVCGATLTRQTVQPASEVSYVRHRVWVVCPGCRRSASVDVKAG